MPDYFNYGDVASALPENYATGPTPESTIAQAVINHIKGLAQLPQQAFESSESLRAGGDYNPAPLVQAATIPMGWRNAVQNLPLYSGSRAVGGMLRSAPSKALTTRPFGSLAVAEEKT